MELERLRKQELEIAEREQWRKIQYEEEMRKLRLQKELDAREIVFDPRPAAASPKLDFILHVGVQNKGKKPIHVYENDEARGVA